STVIVWGELVVPTVWLGNVNDDGERSTAASAPLAVIGTVCGLLAALSVMVTVPDWDSIVVGLKVTVMVQVAFLARLPVQVVVSEKSEGTVPVIAILVKTSGAVPVLFTVITCGALVVPSGTFGNAKLGGVIVATPARPVPVRVAECGLPVALSVTVTLAVRVPDPSGENVTAMLQLNPGASGLTQLFVWAKSPGSAPVMVTGEKVRFAVPLLVRVMFCGALVVPSDWDAKVRLAGKRLTSGTALLMPIPERVMVRGLPGSVSVIVRVAVRVPVPDGVNVIRRVQ